MRARRRRRLGSLYVHVPERAEEHGPYADKRAKKILAFARIGSQTGGPREVWWCPPTPSRKRCRRVRRYEGGQRVWPRRVS
ncbi:MAG TPA: hypothetical protein VJP07_05490 [Dehalococcoidia bacterium]|nr:hypothetical protein [Dehalococcoidia bacterium]